MGDRAPPDEQQQQQQQHAMMQHHHAHYNQQPQQQPVNIPASSLQPLVPPGAVPPTTTAPAAPTWQQQQQQHQPQYQYQYPQRQAQQQHQTWQQQRWQQQQQQQQQQQPGPPPGMGPPPLPLRGQQPPFYAQQQGPPPPRGYGRGGNGGRSGPYPGRQGPGPGRGGRGYDSNGGGNGGGRGGGGGSGPPRPRLPRWVATPAEPHEVAEAESDDAPSTSSSTVTAFWLDPHPRSADDAAFRAARAAHRAASSSSSDAPSPPRDRCVYVLRGLPGAGKSTRAAQLRALAQSKGLECAVHSTDDLCVCPVSGDYKFEAERLPALHDANYSNFEISLQNQVPFVVVDNTNLVAWNYERYVVRAWARGYRVREERVGEFSREAAAAYAERNVHGVPRERIEQMLEGFLRETESGVLMRAPGSRVGW